MVAWTRRVAVVIKKTDLASDNHQTALCVRRGQDGGGGGLRRQTTSPNDVINARIESIECVDHEWENAKQEPLMRNKMLPHCVRRPIKD